MGGLVPATREPAGIQKGYGITKSSSPYLRYVLHEVANIIVLHREPKSLYALYIRIRRRSGKYKVMTALAHKVLIVLWGMMISGTNFEMNSDSYRLYESKLRQLEKVAEAGRWEILEVTG
ncbi:MAG: hypothetical protein ABGF52_01645 [Candidatus Asgardarchaeum sp.]